MPIRKLFNFAELSQASYRLLISGDTEQRIDDLFGLDNNFSQRQAEEFAIRNPEILFQFNSFDTGFSVTVFRDNETESNLVLAFRGTDELFGNDQTTLTQIAFGGAGFDQITDMYNWWLRESNADNVTVAQYKVGSYTVGQDPAPENEILTLFDDIVLGQPHIRYYLVSIADAQGTGGDIFDYLSTGKKVSVTGHSLGGHLAQAFNTLFSFQVSDGYGFNHPGIDNRSEVVDFFQYLGQVHPHAGITSNFHNVIADESNDGNPSLFGVAGLHFTSQQLITFVAIENQLNPVGDHSNQKLTDGAAVYWLLSELDSFLTAEEFHSLFQQSSNQVDITLEHMVDALADMLNLSMDSLLTDVGNRDELYNKIYDIRASTQYQQLSVAGASFSEDEITGTSAKSNFGHFLTLHFLNPLPFNASETILAEIHPELYAQWKSTGPQDPSRFTDEYLTDRAMLWSAMMLRNQADESFLQAIDGKGYRFWDADKNIFITSEIPLGVASYIEVKFDNDQNNSSIAGGNNNDRLYGLGGNDTLQGGAGDDFLDGGVGFDHIQGGADNDILVGGNDEAADILEGGTGFDTYYVNNGDIISDPDNQGAIFFGGKRVSFTDGLQIAENSAEYHSKDGVIYTVTDSALTVRLPAPYAGITSTNNSVSSALASSSPVGFQSFALTVDNTNTFTILNFNMRDFGIVLKPWQDDQPVDEQNPPMHPFPDGPQMPTPGDPSGVDSPIVLDLNGDGIISTLGVVSSSVYFDLNGIGRAERTGWVGPQDGLLVRDINLDGKINNGLELYGTATRSANGDVQSNGFLSLSALDSNLDGVIDASDLQWNELSVWTDTNSNAQTEEGELHTLSSLGILSISLAYTTHHNNFDSHGNETPFVGSYAMEGSIQRLAADVFFKVNTADSRPTTFVEVSSSAALLPNVQAMGNMNSLHSAMTVDPELESLVTQFVAENSREFRLELVEAIILRWAHVSLDEGNLSFGYTSQQASVYEAIYGSPFQGGGIRFQGGLGAHGASMFEALHDYWVDRVYSELIQQTHLSELFQAIDYTFDPVSNSYFGDLTEVISIIDTELATDRQAGLDLLSEFSAALRDGMMRRYHNYDDFRSHFLSLDKEIALAFSSAGSNTVTGGPNNNIHTILAGNYFLDDQNGNDIVYKREQGQFTANLSDGNNFVSSDFRQQFMSGVEFETLIYAGDGNNTLQIGDAYITLRIGNGDNRIHFAGGISSTELGNGNNHLTFSTPGDGANPSLGNKHGMSLGNGDNTLIITSPGVYTITMGNGNNGAEINNAGTLSLSSGSGHDNVYVSSTASTVDLKAGNDIAVIYDANVDLNLGDGKDLADVSESTGAIYAGAGDDNVIVQGGTLNIELGSGHDSISISGGSHDVTGGQGNDEFVIHGGSHRFSFLLGDGQDSIEFVDDAVSNTYVFEFGGSITQSDISLSLDAESFYVNYGAGEDRIKFSSSVAQPGLLNVIQFKFSDNTTATISSLLNTKVLSIIGFDGSDILDASAQNKAVKIFGMLGDDSLLGSNFHDTLDGGAGDDYLAGGPGNDTYLFGIGYGTDTIFETSGTDKIVISAGILPEDIRLGRLDSSLQLTILATGESLVVENWFSATSNRVETIEFDNGTVWNTTTILAAAYIGTAGADYLYGTTGANTLIGLAGNDFLFADAGADILDGEAGDDFLDGAGGNDTYIFKSGYGHDTISELSGNDVLQFGSGIAPTDVVVGRNNTDLILQISSSIDRVTVSNWFAADAHRIETVSFSEGTTWLKATLNTTTNFIGTLLADTLTGTTGDDVFNNSLGNDTYYGDAGSDIYYFGHGSGRDRIFDSISNTSNIDKVILDFDLLPSDVGLVRDTSSMYLHILGSNDRLQIQGQYSSPGVGVEQIVFSNGTIWGTTEFLAAPSTTVNGTTAAETLTGTLGDDIIYGNSGNDIISGLGSNDTLYGEIGNDTLIGGAGNDSMFGGPGNDIYRFGRGDGNDNITEESGTDRIEMLAGVTTSDVLLGRVNNDLFVRIIDTGDTIKVMGWFDATAQRVESIAFADSTIWSGTTLTAAPFVGTDLNDTIYGTSAANVLLGLAGNDSLYGDGGNDTLDGGAGDDLLDGGDGNDIYKFGRGNGNDTVYEYSTSTGDKIVLGSGILAADVTLTRDQSNLYLLINDTNEVLKMQSWFDHTSHRVERIDFADGTFWATSILAATSSVWVGTVNNDVFYGITGPDKIDGGAGNDTLYGGEGNDTYIYGIGSGHDTISDYDVTSGNVDTIALKDGITVGDIALYRDASHAYIKLLATGEVLTLDSWYSGPEYRVERILFSDNTLWTTTQFLAAHYVLSDASDMLTLSSAAETLYAQGGDDTVYAGSGNDAINGGSGNDSLFGEAGNDVLRGGIGDDYLEGGTNNDVYLFGRGDGEDIITELSTGGTDKIVFDQGITLSDVIFGRFGNDLVIKIQNSLDTVVIRDRFLQSNVLVETIEFSDATTINLGTVAINNTSIGLSSSDLIIGTASADTIFGGSGDDHLDGDLGDDILYGENGNDTLYGQDGNDELSGGAGNDYLAGGAGNDTYYFGIGDGVDTIVENPSEDVQTDKIIFGTGITANMLNVIAVGGNLEISISDTNDKLILQSWFSHGPGLIEIFELSDGTPWQPGSFTGTEFFGTSMADTLFGGAGPDYLIGMEGDDTLIGNAGNDILDGGAGNDFLQGDAGQNTAVFGVGYGLDTFFETTGNGHIQFKEDVLPNQVSVIRDMFHLYFVISATGDALRVLNGWNGAAVGIESVSFHNGTTWTNSDLTGLAQEGTTPFARDILGTTGDDLLIGDDLENSISGGDGDDILDGKGAADIMFGGHGNDTYYVNHAFDYIGDHSGVDTVISSVSYQIASGLDNLTLVGLGALSGTGNSADNIIIGNIANNNLLGLAGNDSIFGNSGNDSLWGGEGDDELHGEAGDDLIFGGLGNDLLIGGAGRDVMYGGAGSDGYRFGSASGQDIIFDTDDTAGNVDYIAFDEDLISHDIQLSKNGDDLVLSVVNADASITIKNFYLGSDNVVEEARFSDSTVWDLVQLAIGVAANSGNSQAAILAPNTTNDTENESEFIASGAEVELVGLFSFKIAEFWI